MSQKARLTLEGDDPSGSLSMSLADALARAKGVDDTELGFCLHDYVDVSALAGLFGSKSGRFLRRGTVSFAVEEWLVVVDVGRDDEIELTVEPRSAKPIAAAHATAESERSVE